MNKITQLLVMVGIVALFIANPVIGFVAVGLYIYKK